jgi:hypothetical protein
MKKDTHKKVTRALIAGLLTTNLPIPMAHAGGFEEGQETLTPPPLTPTSDDVSETGEALAPPISSAPSTGPAEATPL